jgi:probable F420-dependent oxidoreductase
MQFGINVQNMRPWTTGETIEMLGTRAEELGFDSVWVSDHVVIPERMESTYPYGGPGTFTPATVGNCFEAITTLAFLAGRTSRIQLGVSVLVVPQRPPLLSAKQWATLDALAGGRTILGVGTGWLREEFVALGAETFERRGTALDEAIRIFRTTWSQPSPVSFAGEVYSFEPQHVNPKPARAGGPPIWIGGHGRRALRRAAELGNGWQGVPMSLEELSTVFATLEDLLGQHRRRLNDLELAMALAAFPPGTRSAGPPTDSYLVGSPAEMAERVRQYAALGIRHVLLHPEPRDSAASVAESMEFFAREVRPQVAG